MDTEEILKLKEQIKQEILNEIKTNKSDETVWRKINKEFKDDFKKFNYIHHWEFLNCDNKLISQDFYRNTETTLKNSIGGLLKIAYKVDSTSKINENYEHVKTAVQDILNILDRERKTKEEVI